ncbi:hypothetical protein EX30DRAFT_355436 [Ascodesmis nigricans]|uniref:1,3-beta-glucanosyltransferase n=1 Tax=Ascodesmis nigricans TaxID=341454 RepID=A0A4S2MUG7_9PEZI|nr:hypothetical protein EX30DRAFT_355436 [Ascodesmis nigricans]
MKVTVGSALCAAFLFGSTIAAELDPIVIKGNKFFYKTNGTQFFIKGVAYQEDTSRGKTLDEVPREYIDPLADAAGCKRDIPYLKELGTNTIRVYSIDPTADHDDCMEQLQEAGIYVVSDLSEPSLSINRDSPAWNDALYERYTAVVDSLQKYPNVLGFFAGNEVTNNATNTPASAYVKAAVRDMKAYIKEKGYRSIPVGYATNDDADIRVPIAQYFNCDTEEDSIDFWGYNIYSWCGRDSSFQKSGYDVRTKEFEKYSKPVFFAEYGCNEVRPREFGDVEALYGSQMTSVWSGGIVYMYFEEENKYGLVQLDGKSVTRLTDFKNLKSQISKVKPKTIQASSYTPSNTDLEECPAAGKHWDAAVKLPPTPNEQLCKCMTQYAACSASTSVTSEAIATHFSYICGEGGVDCSPISSNGATGEYGLYSMCSPVEQLTWAMNQYFNDQDQDETACDFDGDAKIVSPKMSGTCDKVLDEAESSLPDSTPKTTDSDKSAATINSPAKLGFAVLAAIIGSAFVTLA